MYDTRPDALHIQRDLDLAERELEAFEGAVTRRVFVERLRANNPLHPALWASRTALFLFALFAGMTLAWTTAVALGTGVPPVLVELLESSVVPGPLILGGIALCALAVAAASREFAAELGASRPMLPTESRVHQQLKSEVLRLRALRQVERRLIDTPRPALARELYGAA